VHQKNVRAGGSCRSYETQIYQEIVDDRRIARNGLGTSRVPAEPKKNGTKSEVYDINLFDFLGKVENPNGE
jgi:hypothetical protein